MYFLRPKYRIGLRNPTFRNRSMIRVLTKHCATCLHAIHDSSTLTSKYFFTARSKDLVSRSIKYFMKSADLTLSGWPLAVVAISPFHGLYGNVSGVFFSKCTMVKFVRYSSTLYTHVRTQYCGNFYNCNYFAFVIVYLKIKMDCCVI